MDKKITDWQKSKKLIHYVHNKSEIQFTDSQTISTSTLEQELSKNPPNYVFLHFSFPDDELREFLGEHYEDFNIKGLVVFSNKFRDIVYDYRNNPNLIDKISKDLFYKNLSDFVESYPPENVDEDMLPILAFGKNWPMEFTLYYRSILFKLLYNTKDNDEVYPEDSDMQEVSEVLQKILEQKERVCNNSLNQDDFDDLFGKEIENIKGKTKNELIKYIDKSWIQKIKECLQ